MKVRKAKRTIASSQFKPTVGYSPATIIPAAPAGGGTNAAAMRATFAFLPVNQDEIKKREYTDKAEWRAKNKEAPESDYPGMASLFGQKVVNVAPVVPTPTCQFGYGWCAAANACWPTEKLIRDGCY
jgi:hypothetical protein